MVADLLAGRLQGTLPSRISFREVGPREGFQRGPIVSVEARVAVINKLVEAGMKRVQIVSLVNPKLVPQMAGAETVIRLVDHPPDVIYDAVCLNLRGVQRAIATRTGNGVGLDQVDFPGATTDSVLRANGIPYSVAEYFGKVLPEWVRTAKEAGLRAVTGVSAAYGCSMEGPITQQHAIDVAKMARDAGVDEMYISDSTGEASPVQVVSLFERLLVEIPDFTFLVHFHNNRGAAIACAFALMQLGQEASDRLVYDTAILEHGGCPFLEASGNLSTEDMVCMAHSMGVATGLDFHKVLEAARLARDQYQPTEMHFMSHALAYGAPNWWPKPAAAPSGA